MSGIAQMFVGGGYAPAVFAFTISSNQIDANLRTLAINAGWNGTIPVQATINSGVWISGSVQANSTAALTINGSFPNGVTLTNNGTIAGRGGTGGNGGWQYAVATAGTAGGLALLASVGVTIQNNGTIAGGGGGGSGANGASGSGNCFMSEESCSVTLAGGGGGGGQSNVSFNGTGGTTFTSGGSGGRGCSFTQGTAAGSGTSGGAGSGGAGGQSFGCTCTFCSNLTAGTGASGGSWGSAGGSLTYAGGAAGFAVSGNGNISWTAFGTRLGPIG